MEPHSSIHFRSAVHSNSRNPISQIRTHRLAAISRQLNLLQDALSFTNMSLTCTNTSTPPNPRVSSPAPICILHPRRAPASHELHRVTTNTSDVSHLTARRAVHARQPVLPRCCYLIVDFLVCHKISQHTNQLSFALLLT